MCARRGLLGVSGCRYTDCKCAAGLVAVLLGLYGRMCVCVCVLWHQQPYSNLFLSLIIVWSNVKPKPLFSLAVFPSPPPLPPAPAERFGSGRAQRGLPQPRFSGLLAGIMTSRGQPAPRYHVLSQRHCGRACFVLPCLYKALNVSCNLASVGACQSNLTQEEQLGLRVKTVSN